MKKSEFILRSLRMQNESSCFEGKWDGPSRFCVWEGIGSAVYDPDMDHAWSIAQTLHILVYCQVIDGRVCMVFHGFNEEEEVC